jgi:hypothetical protein
LSFRESRAPGGEQANALDTDRWYWKKAEIFWVMGSRMLKRVRGSLNTPPHGWIKACESRVRAGGGGVAAAPLADSVYQRRDGRGCGRIGRPGCVVRDGRLCEENSAAVDGQRELLDTDLAALHVTQA